jgi:hypothetical protein
LIIAGVKTIEIRKWSTSQRGKILIHAALIPDERPEGWSHVSDEIRPLAELVGGVIGEAELHGMTLYRSAAAFKMDQLRHLNDPSWFDGPTMYGFLLRNPATVPFRACRGKSKIFSLS